MHRDVYKLVRFVETAPVASIVDRARNPDEAAKIAGVFWNYRHWPTVVDRALPVLVNLPDAAPDAALRQIARAAAWNFVENDKFDVPAVAKAMAPGKPAATLAVAEELAASECCQDIMYDLVGTITNTKYYNARWLTGVARPTGAPAEADARALWRWLVTAFRAYSTTCGSSLDWAAWFNNQPLNRATRTAVSLLLAALDTDAANDLPHPMVVATIVRTARRHRDKVLFRAAEQAVRSLTSADRVQHLVVLLPELSGFSYETVEPIADKLVNRSDAYRVDGLAWFYGSKYCP